MILAFFFKLLDLSTASHISSIGKPVHKHIKRIELNNDEIIERLGKLLSKENLENKKLDDYIEEREEKIKSLGRSMTDSGNQIVYTSKKKKVN